VAVTEIEAAPAPATLREKLAPPVPGRALWGWLGPLLVTLFAGFLRFNRLGVPHEVVFDETYYAKDAYALLKFGYEHSWVRRPEGQDDTENLADQLFLGGRPDQIWADGGSFIAHPPFGKWMIAVGEQFIGVTPFGWRFTAALAGTLSVLVLCRVARRMTGSTVLGCAAGFLLALDGLHLVTSRTALLDVFLMFWVLAGFACLVADRDRSRRALAAGLDADPSRSFFSGPWIHHPWRILAGLCFGLACGTKWSAAPFLAVFVLMVVLWDVGARRAAGVQFPVSGALVKDGTFAKPPSGKGGDEDMPLTDADAKKVAQAVVRELTHKTTTNQWAVKQGIFKAGDEIDPKTALRQTWAYGKDTHARVRRLEEAVERLTAAVTRLQAQAEGAVESK